MNIALVLGLLALGVLSVICFSQSRSGVAQFGAGIVSLLVAVFSVYGYLAAGELPPEAALGWKWGYAALCALSIAAIIWLRRRYSKARKGWS